MLLKKHGFFNNENDPVEMMPEQAAFKFPESIIFETTEKCNLTCVYCVYGKYYEKAEHLREDKDIETDTAIAYIDYIYDTFGKLPEISFFGGEPLLKFKFIKEIVEYVQQKVPGHDMFDMTTNGLLVKKYADFLSENNFSVMISLDGDEFHNRFRVFPNGKGSFQAVVNNSRFLRENYPDFFNNKVSFAVTSTPDASVDEIKKFFIHTFQKIPYIFSLCNTPLNPLYEDEFYSTFGTPPPLMPLT